MPDPDIFTELIAVKCLVCSLELSSVDNMNGDEWVRLKKLSHEHIEETDHHILLSKSTVLMKGR